MKTAKYSLPDIGRDRHNFRMQFPAIPNNA
jgi:hypothetical protein